MTLVTVTSIFAPGSLPVSVMVDPTWAGLLFAEVFVGLGADGMLLACSAGPAGPLVTGGSAGAPKPAPPPAITKKPNTPRKPRGVRGGGGHGLRGRPPRGPEPGGGAGAA